MEYKLDMSMMFAMHDALRRELADADYGYQRFGDIIDDLWDNIPAGEPAGNQS